MVNIVNHLHISRLNLSRQSFSRYTLSSSCMKKAEEFHSRLCPLALPFGRWNPGSQVPLLLLSFLQHQLVLGVQSCPGCPGLLWLRHGQVPQGIPVQLLCMSMCRIVRHCRTKEAVFGQERMIVWYKN